MKLNILDQSPVISGFTHTEAINQTIGIAKLADKLGYYRYWLSEHHNSNSFASASPEILIPVIASGTKNIRVGSGGVLISHYSSFKIAEQFNLLASIFPGRIDLGIGRAPGGDANIMKVLRTPKEDAFGKTKELLSYLNFKSENNKNEKKNLIAVPEGVNMPEIWILGTSPDSATFAAENGLRYTFGSFINDEQMLQCFQIYYQNFKPSRYLKEPYLNLALFVICGETESDAIRMAKCSEYWLTQTFLKGKNICFPDEKTAVNHNFSLEEKMVIEYRRKNAVIGDAITVAQKLQEISKKYALHELTLVTITSNHSERMNSYKLIAEKL